MTTLLFETALLHDGWADNVAITIDANGDIAHIEANASAQDAARIQGAALPGMPNLHSHAFQRAMAGMGEISGPVRPDSEPDSFWTWRQTMYGFLRTMTPDHAESIATRLYIDMLKAGYTALAEFHYVHHDPTGTPYSERAEMSARMIAAAASTGIGITHLPVLYNFGGFGGTAANDGQRRFLNDADGFMQIVSTLHEVHSNNPQVRIGIAPHSLRAVTPELLANVLGGLNTLDATAPVHIHIAEQTKEVDDCLAWSGQRPVEWLLEHQSIDQRWCLIHATHLIDRETDALAASGAVAGLCPTTEANLGDGLFPARRFMAAGGVMGIGSDSHISVNVKEELRWLEYGQRLFERQRTVLSGGASRSTGAELYNDALVGGAQACGRPIGALEVGKRADIVVLDTAHSPLAGCNGNAILDAWIFACDTNPVAEVFVGGQHVIHNGHHAMEEIAEDNFRATLCALANP